MGILESVVKDFIDNMFACVTEYTCMDILFVFNVQIFIICLEMTYFAPTIFVDQTVWVLWHVVM